SLKPMTAGIRPITDQERQSRREKARRLMRERRIDAIVCEGGSSMYYFTGIRRTAGDALFALILPASGEPVWVTLASDKKAAGGLPASAVVRSWNRSNAAFKTLGQALKDSSTGFGRIGIEERTRFFVVDGLRREVGGAELVSADPVTAGCRMLKSP